MDTLVARYSRPAYLENEVFSEQEQQDLTDSVPSLSLKFAMPPVAHVRRLILGPRAGQL
jgi:20S proteasome subunit beta 5